MTNGTIKTIRYTLSDGKRIDFTGDYVQRLTFEEQFEDGPIFIESGAEIATAARLVENDKLDTAASRLRDARKALMSRLDRVNPPAVTRDLRDALYAVFDALELIKSANHPQ